MNRPVIEEQTHESAVFQRWLRFWRMILAGVQILGGIAGGYSATATLFENIPVGSKVIALIFDVLYAMAFLGGILLALNKTPGVVISFIVQGVQLLQVWTDGFAFSFVCGLQLLIGVSPSENGPGLQFFGGIASVSNLYFGSPPEGSPRIVGINMIAVLAIICLLYLKHGKLLTAPELGPDQNAWLSPPKPAPPKQEAWPPAPKSRDSSD